MTAGAALLLYTGICVIKFGVELIIDWAAVGKEDSAVSPIPVLEEANTYSTQMNFSVFLEDERVVKAQSMMLINKDHLLSDDFEADVSEYGESGVWMNKCIQEAYKSLADEVKERFGEKLYVASAFRTAAEQQRQIEEESEEIAQSIGASEHQAGLCLDVYIMNYSGMGFIESETGKWLNSDCWRHGFIIRYPSDGEESTGIDYEPWHIRYTGQPHAEYIMRNGITLEKYISGLLDGVLYEVECSDGKYEVVRFSGDVVPVPGTFMSAVISEDNCGGHIAAYKISDPSEPEDDSAS